MKKELPQSLVYGIAGAVLIAFILVGFFALRDKPPTTAINMVGRDKLKPPPPAQAPPDWVIQKLRGGGK